jgi:hypothetical protein
MLCSIMSVVVLQAHLLLPFASVVTSSIRQSIFRSALSNCARCDKMSA